MHGGRRRRGGTTERPGRLYLKAFLSAMSMMPLLDVGSQQYVVDGVHLSCGTGSGTGATGFNFKSLLTKAQYRFNKWTCIHQTPSSHITLIQTTVDVPVSCQP